MKPFELSFGQAPTAPVVEDEEILDDTPDIPIEEEIETVAPVSESVPESIETDEPIVGERTGSAVLADYYKDKGLIPQEVEISNDFSSGDLVELLERTIRDRVKDEVEDEFRSKGYDDTLVKYAEIIAQGGNPQGIQEHAQYDMLSRYEPNNEDEQKQIIQYMYKDKGLKDKDVSRILDNAEMDDELDDLFKESQVYFANKRDAHLDLMESQLKEQRKIEEKEKKRQEDKYREGIRRGLVGSFTLSENEIRQFEKDFLEPTERYVVENPDGTKTTTKITKYYKRLMEINRDPTLTLEIAHHILYGTKPLEDKARSKAISELDAVLKPRPTLATKKSETTITTPSGAPLFKL
jgi:DNA-binding transcriptional MerR regulator